MHFKQTTSEKTSLTLEHLMLQSHTYCHCILREILDQFMLIASKTINQQEPINISLFYSQMHLSQENGHNLFILSRR